MYSVILFTVFLTALIIRYLCINSNYWKKRNVMQRNGFLWRLLITKKSVSEIFKEIYDDHPKLPYVGIFYSETPALILRDRKNIEAVLHGDFVNFHARDIRKNDNDCLSDNLLFIDNINRWKLIRQKFSPFLTTTMLKNMFYLTERCAKDFISFITENPEFKQDTFSAIHTYTAACIGSKIFEIEEETKNVMNTPLTKIICEILQANVNVKFGFVLSCLLPNLYKWLNFKVSGTYEDKFITMVKKAMTKKRMFEKRSPGFINVCLKLEEQKVLKDTVTGYEIDVTLNFLAAQMYVFFLGGIDTIVSVIHFTLLELSNNNNILEKVHVEIDRLFENNGDVINFEDLEKLVYMEMVLYETMRKYPPVGVTQRKCCKDTILPVGNLMIEKGSNVIIPIFALHRDENYFPNPDVFDPERFSKKNASKINKYCYLPFGEGKRVCVGTKLAFMEMKVCLAWLLRKYTLKQQAYVPKHFNPRILILHDPKAQCQIVPRR